MRKAARTSADDAHRAKDSNYTSIVPRYDGADRPVELGALIDQVAQEGIPPKCLGCFIGE